MTENSAANPKRKTRGRYKTSTQQLFTKLETLFFGHKFSEKPDWFLELQKNAETNDGWIDLGDIIKNDVHCKPLTDASLAYLKQLVASSKLIRLNYDGSKVKSLSDTYNAEDFGIFVDNIPLEANVCWIEEAFRNYGNILLVQMPKAKFKNELIKNRGFCFVYFSQPDDAKKAIETFDRHKNQKAQVIKDEMLEKTAVAEDLPPQPASTTKHKYSKLKRALAISPTHQTYPVTHSEHDQTKKIKIQLPGAIDQSKSDRLSRSVDLLQQSGSGHVMKGKIKPKKRRLDQLLQADDVITNPAKRVEVGIREPVACASHEAVLQQEPAQTSREVEDLESVAIVTTTSALSSETKINTEPKFPSKLKSGASTSSSKKKRKADEGADPSAHEQKQTVKSVVLKVLNKKRRRTSSDGNIFIPKKRRRSGKRQRDICDSDGDDGSGTKSIVKRQRVEPEVKETALGKKRKHRRKNLNRIRRYIKNRHIRCNLLDHVNVYSYSDWLLMKREYINIQRSNFQELKNRLANDQNSTIDNEAFVVDGAKLEKQKRSRDRIVAKAVAFSEAMIEKASHPIQ